MPKTKKKAEATGGTEYTHVQPEPRKSEPGVCDCPEGRNCLNYPQYVWDADRNGHVVHP